MKPPDLPASQTLMKQQQTEDARASLKGPQLSVTRLNFVQKSAAFLVLNQRAYNFRAWLYTTLQPISSYRKEQITINNYLKRADEIKVKLEWIYGIRCQDVKRALQYAVGEKYATSIGKRSVYEKKLE